MKLNDYLKSPGALSVRQLAVAVGVKSDMQIRQWQHSYRGRKPGPIYCRAIEQATKGLVTRKELRPDDWQRIWPELADQPDANGVDSQTQPQGQGA